VSKPLADYAKTLNDKMRIVTIPNGVNLNSLIDHSKFRDTDYEEKTAVFVGAIEEWVDTELIDRTARLLKNWRFDIYGPKSKRWDIQSENVHYCGVIPKNQVSSKLLNYEVGLIPFRKHDLIKVMERPLKFYEYLAANLGIASTDVGYLREGMGNWVEFGNTPEEFAAAIELASQKRKQRTTREIYLYLQEYSWEKIIDQIIERL
jgi:glycosyltransferase involved in cell wall biosynthesis